MKIVTYNMQQGGSPDWLQWAKIIEAFDPDLLLAQESCDTGKYKLPQGHDNLKSKTVWWPVEGRYWSSAVYVKSGRFTPLTTLDNFNGLLAGAEVEGYSRLGRRRLRIFSLHAPKPYLETVEEMLKVIWRNREDADLIIGGDFNFTLGKRHHSEKNDDGTPWITTTEELEIQRRLREEFELINCWQTANPDVPLAQTLRLSGEFRPAFCPQCPPVRSFHCDGIFIPASWKVTPFCTVVNNEEWTGRNDGNPPRSDHNPVVATFADLG